MTNSEAVDRAIAKAGGRRALGEAVQVSRETVRKWRLGMYMDERDAIKVETATGVRVEELRPDLEWERDAAGQVVAYRVPLPSTAIAQAA